MDKAFRWKLAITLAMIVLSLWAVVPTFRLFSMSAAEMPI